MTETKKTGIAKTAFWVSVISTVSLMFSFVQESVFAFFFGATAFTDAYAVAIQIPVSLFSIISTAITNIVIPCYSKELYRKDKESAKRYASNFMTMIGIITIALIILGEIFAKYLVIAFAPGMSLAAKECATIVFRLVLPTVLLTELMNINIGILNVHKSFILPALTSNLLNISFVTTVAILQGKYGIYAAAIGMVIGSVIEFLYTELLRRKYFKYQFVVDTHDESMKQSLKMAIPIFVGIGATEINKMIDKIIASFLGSGNISMLNYASKLSSALSSLLVTGIMTVIYPEFAKNAANEDDQKNADIFVRTINIFLIIILPVIAGIAVLGEEAIKIVYGRGAFTMEMVKKTSPLFFCYVVCLLFTIFRQISSRVFYSHGDSKTPMKNSMIGIGVNIVLNVVLGMLLGALGLALATTIATMVISMLLFKDIKIRNPYIEYKSSLKVAGKCLIGCFVMAIVLVLSKWIAIKYLNYELSSMLSVVLFSIVTVLIGAIVYLIVLILVKTEEVKKVTSKILRRRR